MQAQLLQSMMGAGLGWLAAFPLIQQACPVCRTAAGSGRFPCLAGVSAPAQPSAADKAEQGRTALTPRGRDSVWQALQALHSVYEVRLKPAPCCSHCLLACLLACCKDKLCIDWLTMPFAEKPQGGLCSPCDERCATQRMSPDMHARPWNESEWWPPTECRF